MKCMLMSFFVIMSPDFACSMVNEEPETSLTHRQNIKPDSALPVIEQTLSNDCSICLKDLNCKKISTIPCSHIFHTNCIVKWFKQQEKKKQDATCPNCREKIAQEACDTLLMKSETSPRVCGLCIVL